jgi:MYXO-CTERM domain-containing protein
MSVTWRRPAAIATLLVVTGLGTSAADARARSSSAGLATLDALPWTQRIGLEQAIAARDPRMQPRRVDGVPTLDAGGVLARFDRDGARLAIGDHVATLRTARIGRREMHELPAETPTIEDGEIHTRRGELVTEWWRALPSGLEHGYTIADRPIGNGELRIELTLHGVSARAAADGVELVDTAGERAGLYTHLFVTDATSAVVPAHMAAEGTSITIVVDDAGAQYPLTIDPLLVATQEAELTASDAANGDWFGISVAMDSSGTRALVGAPLHSSSAGTAYVLLRTGTSWTQEAELRASDGAANDWFGYSLALDSTGTRALIGAYQHASQTGAAYVFLRTGTSWTQEAELTASDAAVNNSFGRAVALDSMGLSALVGAPNRASNTGAVYAFARTGTSWTQQAELTASDATTANLFGAAVALDSSGARALIGAWLRAAGTGAAYVFTSTGTSWAQEAELSASDGAINDHFGVAVALDATAARALVGASGRTSAAGAAYTFVRTGTSWTQEAELAASDGTPNGSFGSSVALDPTATRALIGANGTAMGTGSAYVFVRVAATWTQGVEVTASDGMSVDFFGESVALASGGALALIGARGHASTGAAYAFTLGTTDPNGTACTRGATCLSGICVEGVCCDAGCGGGYSATGVNCSSCLARNTGSVDGTCAPLSAAVAPTVTCHPAPSCFAVATCVPTSTTCPSAVMAAGATCRSAASLGLACAMDAVCDGTSSVCPASNPPRPAGAVCHGMTGACDVTEHCDGSSLACPPDMLLPAGTLCHAATDATCDATTMCTGSSPNCPTAFAPVTTPCGAGTLGVCELMHHCNGTGGCVAAYASGVVCRAAAGACDVAESCTGADANCPPDAVEGAGTVCRTSTNPSCDPAEHCDGTSSMCPADVDTCTAMPDMGVTSDAATASDAGTNDSGARDAMASDAAHGNTDAGSTPPPIATSCGCRAGRRGDGAWVALLALAYVVRRRRR